MTWTSVWILAGWVVAVLGLVLFLLGVERLPIVAALHDWLLLAAFCFLAARTGQRAP